MVHRLPSERITVEIEAGPSVEVERIAAFGVYWTGLALVSAFMDEKQPATQFEMLSNVCAYVAVEAQPTFEISDHRGPLPPTREGLMRLSYQIIIAIAEGWLDTFVVKSSAVDEVIEPGPARDELNRRLKAARKAA